MPVRTGLIYIVLLVIVSAGGCRPESHIVNIQAHWSSMNPQSIPLNIRQKEQAKNNLVTNPSFELGRYYLADTVKLSFNLPGWKKVGENVFWTNTQKTGEYDVDEASNGIHSIKIIRRNADETDIQGEGIISDYIKVIPGNYQLSLDIRLKNIESNLERLVENIYDAVNIRLYFYDRNKVLIRSNAYHPVFDRWIDNSFKAAGFANFSYINEFPWARMIARAGNYPFVEGYIPDEARYVRIFAGLKGTGTLWVDMVDFSYGNENFTFLEKTEALFDSTLERSRLLIPEPHEAGFYKPLDLTPINDAGEELKPLILLPASSDQQMRKIVGRFIEGLKQRNVFAPSENPVINRISTREIESGRLIFSFGNTILLNQYADQLTVEELMGNEQACFIRRISPLENVVFVGYSDYQGLFRAVNILDQLIDTDQQIYHHYDIADYPDFLTRGAIVPVMAENDPRFFRKEMEFLTASGLNEFIVEPGDQQDAGNSVNKLGLEVRKIIADQDGSLTFLQQGYSFRNLAYDNLNDTRSNQPEYDSAAYLKAMALDGRAHARLVSGLKAGVSEKLLFSDKGLWNCMDLGPVHNSFKLNNVYDLNRFMAFRKEYWQSLKSENPDMQRFDLYLEPLISDNRIKNQANILEDIYFRELLNRNLPFKDVLWTGPAAHSFLIDDVNYELYKGSYPFGIILFDNSMAILREENVPLSYNAIYPGIMTTGILFDPYHVNITHEVLEDINYECILNTGKLNEFSIIRLATAADFLWNNNDYDPFISAWKILQARYGKEGAIELVYFNDHYYHLLSVCMQLEMKEANQKLIKTGDELRMALEERWESLKNRFDGNLDLLNELSDYKNLAISRYMQAKRESAGREPKN